MTKLPCHKEASHTQSSDQALGQPRQRVPTLVQPSTTVDNAQHEHADGDDERPGQDQLTTEASV